MPTRERMVTVRLTEDEHRRIQREAKQADVSLSEWIRRKLSAERAPGVEPHRKRWKLARTIAARFTSMDGLPLEELWLYGSVARGDAGPGSDIDFLVVLDVERDRRLGWLDRLYEEVMELEWESGVRVSLQVYTVEMWERQRTTSYGREVRRDGIRFRGRESAGADAESAA